MVRFGKTETADCFLVIIEWSCLGTLSFVNLFLLNIAIFISIGDICITGVVYGHFARNRSKPFDV